MVVHVLTTQTRSKKIVQRIPLYECINRRIYEVKSRNLLWGVYRQRTKGFIGIRTKLGARFLFEEHHWDADPHLGTVSAMRDTGVDLPVHIELCCDRVGPYGSRTGKAMYWQRDTDDPATGRWYYSKDNTVSAKGDYPRTASNKVLFDWLVAWQK